MSRHKHLHHQPNTPHTPHIVNGATPGPTDAPVGGQPVVERIRLRAYEISITRNGEPGDELSDWVQAELELNGATGSEHAHDEAMCDPSTLEIKTRSQPSLATARGGL